MSAFPKARCYDEGIDLSLLPPDALIAATVKLAMMKSADRNSEPITNFSPHGPALGKFNVMGIRRGATADETRLSGHKSKMISITLGYWLADNSDFPRTVPDTLLLSGDIGVHFALLSPW
jgi:hypothetical protein